MFTTIQGGGCLSQYREPLAEQHRNLFLIVNPTIGLYHEIWRLNEIRSLKRLQTWVKNIFCENAILLLVTLCVLMVHHWQIPPPSTIYEDSRLGKNRFNIGELI